MIPGQLANVRAVLDYLSTVEPFPIPPPTGNRPTTVAVEVDAKGNFWAYPSEILAGTTWPPKSSLRSPRERLEVVGKVLRALGWAPVGRIVGIDPLRRAYYLKPYRPGTSA